MRIALALLALIAGCSRTPDLSLKKGKSWKYSGADGAEYVMEVVGDDTVNGKKCRVVRLSSGGEPLITRYLYEENGGLREARTQLREVEIVYKDPKWFLRGPAEAGSQFGEGVETGPPGGRITYLGTFETEEDVTVPAGTFHCWRVKCKADMGTTFHLRETLWICEGVGIVKFEHESGFNSVTTVIAGELVSHE